MWLRDGSGLATWGRMKRIIAMAAAAALVLLQLGAFAALSAEEPHDFTPIDATELVAERA